MTNHESEPRNHERDNPERPALPEEPANLNAIIGEAFDEADASGGELTEWGARAIARSLAEQRDEPSPALKSFATTGEGDLEALSLEAMPIHNQPGCSTWVKQQVDYLLTFLLERARPPATHAMLTAESAAPTEAMPSPQAIEGINQHGDAFRAFLTLPDIKPDDPGVLDSFHECFVGRFASMDEILQSLTEIDMWQAEADALGDHLGIPVYLDHQFIAAHLRDTWDIVRFGSARYVFEK